MEVIIFAALILIVLIYTSIKSQLEIKKKNRQRLLDEYDSELERELEYDTYENLKTYFYDVSSNYENVIDDDTWDDLNMDSVYMQINNTNSSVGREYLYAALRHPHTDVDALHALDKMAEGFHENPDIRIKVQEEFVKLGYANRISVYRYMKDIMELETKQNWIHYGQLAFLVLSAGIMAFVRADIGVVLFIAAMALTVISYFREKARIESYLSCVKWIVRMIHASEIIVKMNIPFLKMHDENLKNIIRVMGKIQKNMFLITSGSGMTGSLAEVIMDYIRILTHADLIKFNNILRDIRKYQEEIIQMYEILGHVESSIAVASYRNKLAVWSRPEFIKDHPYEVMDLYHPLLSEPVANSICTAGCILLTGSNASGKSTFLKAAAVNALLSQTIYTSTSTGYKGDFYRIVSSMSHKDDIMNGDSYYMVEIKALKRILELSRKSEFTVLCFLDEVLRGTNTVERIAASAQILRSFPKKGALCFAATHDIELTKLLGDLYDNYHFDESFENNDVKYNYILKKGPAVTRNAIKLLAQTGYDKELIDDAVRMTEIFEKTGRWENLS